MLSLLEDLPRSAAWLVSAFAAEHKTLDYSLESLQIIDVFFDRETENGQPKPDSHLGKNFGPVMFAITAYVGETLRKNIPGSTWKTDESVPKPELNVQIVFGSKVIFPGQKVFKRLKNGAEDSLYSFGMIEAGKATEVKL